MPNWCSNHIIVEGEKSEILNLIDIASSGSDENNNKNFFSFENVVPTPKELLEGDGWHSWRIENWGTKWDLHQDEKMFSNLEQGGVEGNMVFHLKYETAWSPAISFWMQVSDKFKSLQITNEFFEEGNDFIGQVYIVEGNIVDEVSRAFTKKDYILAGAVLDDEGWVDWDATDNLDLWSLFPLDSD